MGDPQKQAERAQKLLEAGVKATSMTDDELKQAFDGWNMGANVSQITEEHQLEKFASLIASTDSDQTLSEKEDEQDYYAKRNFARDMADVYAAELKSRGYVIGEQTGHLPTATLKPSESETGHYDDGHAFGWKKPADSQAPDDAPDFGWKKKDASPDASALDTGHYDDGHAFGWQKKATAVPMPLVGIGAAGLLLVAGLLFLNRPATVAGDTTQAAATSSLTASTSAPLGTRPAAVIDVCALVTTAESSTILEKPTTTQTTTPGLQCFYKPQTPATWSFKEGTGTGNLRVDSLFVTIATGADAQSRYAAKQAIYGKDPTVDEVVSGVGDKALFTAGTELSVLAGSRFINVRFQGDYDWGSGNTRYETVHQKIISLLSAFAKTALPRMP